MSTDLSLTKHQLNSPSSRPCCACTRCRQRCPCTCSTFLTIAFRVFLLTFLGASIFLIIFFWSPLSSAFLDILRLLKDQPPHYIALVLLLSNIIAALMFLPCLPFTMAAGYFFRTIRGTIIIAVASTVAAVLAFLVGRYLARSAVEKSLGSKNSKWRVMDNAINSDGFRIVFLIRLSPLHPYGVMNYLFGLTSVTLRDYTFASFFAMLPTTVMEVYSGASLSRLDEVLSGESSVLSGAMMGVGLVVTIVVSVVITVWVRRKLKAELDRYAPVSEEEEDEEIEVQLDGIDVSDDETEEGGIKQDHSYARHDTAGEGDKGVEDEEKEAKETTPSDVEMTVVSISSTLPPSTASPSSSPPSSTTVSPSPTPTPTQRRISRQSSPNQSPVHVAPVASSPVHLALRGGQGLVQIEKVGLGSGGLQLMRGVSAASTGSDGGETGEQEVDKLIKHR